MCEDLEDFSTVAGPLGVLRELQRVWEELQTVRRLGLQAPVIIELSEISRDTSERFNHWDSPAIAVVRHERGVGMRAAAQAPAELATNLHFLSARPYYPELYPPGLFGYGSGLIWEPGYRFRAAQGGSGNVQVLDQATLNQLAQSAPNIPQGEKAAGPRVAVLDTGVSGANTQMIDFLRCDVSSPKVVNPDDQHGHGTAVAQIIEAVPNNSVIHPIRALDVDPAGYASGRSYEVLSALLYALYSDSYDLINASFTTSVSSSCDSSLGNTIDYLVAYRRAHRLPGPMLVAAAGNDYGAASGYPANVAGSVVALANTSSGPATYNSTPPMSAITCWAYGGSDTHPLGDLTGRSPSGPTGEAAKLWGTSFAAAVVSGAYLP
ncbi:S8/S53 family peptidase [Kitasatospora sp. NPDC048239]|uniref:S8/S53 family peptidase n=1 Tax=Kitasatospora sp. NPDC048239 TaxID=3364046 RepID=UPI003719178D